MAGVIVVGVGGDGSGVKAAHLAARVANLMGAALVLVFGYEAQALGPRGGVLEEEIAAVGSAALVPLKDALKAEHPQLDVSIELVHDRPVESLIRMADERRAELIVVGHGGNGPLKGALLGSITYEIVHRAPLPVLVVPEGDD